jgi:hypothetical protein
MELIIPEILAEARQLSLALQLFGLLLGLTLWLAGWWSYRFWVALMLTVAAGVVAMVEAPLFQMEPLLAALLLAIAAGLLALSLMRLFAFAAAGLLSLALAQVMAPSVDAPWVCFLAGGILASILFRLWMMAMTSFCGALLTIYSVLCLLELLGLADCSRWGREHGILLNWMCLLSTVLGAVVQFLVYRRRSKKDGGEAKPPGKGIAGRLRMLVPFRKAA